MNLRKKRVQTNKTAIGKPNIPDENVWKNPNAKSKSTKKVKLFPRPSRGQYQPPLVKMNMRDLKRELNGRVDEIAEAALAIVHNKIVNFEVKFQKDVAKLQQLYHQVHFKPLQNLRTTLLTSISKPQQFRPTVENIKEKMRKTSIDINTISYDRLLRQCHLLVYAAPEMREKNFAANFWKKVLLNSESLIRKIIHENDELLNYIEDISCDSIMFNNDSNDQGQEYEENGFQICFKFSRSNPYFYNRRIVKRYVVDVYPRDKLEFLQSNIGSKSKCPQEEDMISYTGPRLVEICTTSVDWKDKGKINLNSTKIHSLLDYLNFNWTEQKNTNNKTAELDYLIAAYIKDNLVPNAYGIYHKAMSSSASYSMKDKQSENPSQHATGISPQLNISTDQPCCSKMKKETFQPLFSGNYNTTSLLNFLDTVDGGQQGTTAGLKTWSAAELDARGRKRAGDNNHELDGLYPFKFPCLTPRTQGGDRNKIMSVDPYKLSLSKFSILNWKAPKPSCGVQASSSWESVDEEGLDEDGAVPNVSTGYGSVVPKRKGKSKKQVLNTIRKNLRKYKRTNMKEKFLRRRSTINRMKATGNRSGTNPLTTSMLTLPTNIDNNVPFVSGTPLNLTVKVTKLKQKQMKQQFNTQNQFNRSRNFIRTKSSSSSSSSTDSDKTTTSKVLKRQQSWSTVSECSVRSVASKLTTAKSHMIRLAKSATRPRIYGNLPILARTKRSESVTEISLVLWKDFIATNCLLSGKDKRLFDLFQEGEEESCSKIEPTNNEATRSRKRKRSGESDDETPRKQYDGEGRQDRGECTTVFENIRKWIWHSFSAKKH